VRVVIGGGGGDGGGGGGGMSGCVGGITRKVASDASEPEAEGRARGALTVAVMVAIWPRHDR